MFHRHKYSQNMNIKLAGLNRPLFHPLPFPSVVFSVMLFAPTLLWHIPESRAKTRHTRPKLPGRAKTLHAGKKPDQKKTTQSYIYIIKVI